MTPGPIYAIICVFTMLIIDIIQIVSATLLVIVILMQNKGAGLGAVFGGGDGEVARKKRGAEKGLFVTTIILSIVFLGTAVVNLLY